MRGMNANENGREARARNAKRLRKLTIGTAILGVAATGGFGALAAVTYDGTTAATTIAYTTAATGSTTGTTSAPATGTATPAGTTTATATAAPAVTTTTGTAHVSTGSS
jgi:hypothetical protein